MKVIHLIGRITWKTWFFTCFLTIFLLFYFFFFILIKSKNIYLAYKLKKIWGSIICYLSGIFPISIKSKNYQYPIPCIIVSNHSSYLDIITNVLHIPSTTLFLAKVELKKIPLFSIFFNGMDIPVDRKNIKAAHQSLELCAQALDKGFNITIFPEGTISSDGVLKPFKSGAFKLAIEKQLPIVAIVNHQNWKILQNGGFFKSFGRPGFTYSTILEPIKTIGLTVDDIDFLKQKTYLLIKQTLENYDAKN